jgi:hypothetical protein
VPWRAAHAGGLGGRRRPRACPTERRNIPGQKKVLTRGRIRSKVLQVGSLIAQSSAPQPAGNLLTRPPKALTRPRPPMAITRHPAPPVRRVRGKVCRTRNPKGNRRSRETGDGSPKWWVGCRIPEVTGKLKITEEGRSGSSKNCVRGFAALRSFRLYRAGTERLRGGGCSPLRGRGLADLLELREIEREWMRRRVTGRGVTGNRRDSAALATYPTVPVINGPY